MKNVNPLFDFHRVVFFESYQRKSLNSSLQKPLKKCNMRLPVIFRPCLVSQFPRMSFSHVLDPIINSSNQ